jgi:hypothetical protein
MDPDRERTNTACQSVEPSEQEPRLHPALQLFIDEVIVPALLDRLLATNEANGSSMAPSAFFDTRRHD